MAKRDVDNYRLGQYPVEVELQADESERQVVKVGEIAAGTNIIGKVDVSDTSIKQDPEQHVKLVCLMEQVLVELKIIRTAMGHIIDEHLHETDIEENGL